jgi:hypothetical protein
MYADRSLSCVGSLAFAFLASCAAAADFVAIRDGRNFSRYAGIEAKQIRIHWNPAVTHFPHADDFLSAKIGRAWSAALDGPGVGDEQLLRVSVAFCHRISCMAPRKDDLTHGYCRWMFPSICSHWR